MYLVIKQTFVTLGSVQHFFYDSNISRPCIPVYIVLKMVPLSHVCTDTTVMIVFWLMSVTCSGSCPENSALREALTCLHNLTNGDHSKVSISPADIKQTKSFCE